MRKMNTYSTPKKQETGDAGKRDNSLGTVYPPVVKSSNNSPHRNLRLPTEMRFGSSDMRDRGTPKICNQYR